jgi:hypothetical protein
MLQLPPAAVTFAAIALVSGQREARVVTGNTTGCVVQKFPFCAVMSGMS